MHPILSAFFSVPLAALAGFYIWMLASQLHTPGLRWLQRWLRREWRTPLISCPYCFGFWIAILLILLLQWGELNWIVTPVSVLATAGLIGFVGSFTPGMDEEDD